MDTWYRIAVYLARRERARARLVAPCVPPGARADAALTAPHKPPHRLPREPRRAPEPRPHADEAPTRWAPTAAPTAIEPSASATRRAAQPLKAAPGIALRALRSGALAIGAAWSRSLLAAVVPHPGAAAVIGARAGCGACVPHRMCGEHLLVAAIDAVAAGRRAGRRAVAAGFRPASGPVGHVAYGPERKLRPFMGPARATTVADDARPPSMATVVAECEVLLAWSADVGEVYAVLARRWDGGEIDATDAQRMLREAALAWAHDARDEIARRYTPGRTINLDRTLDEEFVAMMQGERGARERTAAHGERETRQTRRAERSAARLTARRERADAIRKH